MMQVTKLPKSSSHLLTSTQVITSVFCVVKELVENALDSSCTNIEIKLENSGMDKIEVRDNGCGINTNDIAVVVKPHYTSKIQSHLDLETVQSYGFRGEALSAICAISDLSIASKKSNEDIGVMCNMNHIGEILFSKPFSCKQGTVVTVSNLFCNMPVRKQFYKSVKHKKEELKKIEDILIAFSCADPSVRLALYHNKNLIWQKSSVNNIRGVLFQVFGDDILRCMNYAESFNEELQVKIEVYFPKQESKRVTTAHATADRTIVLVNKRPVRMKAFDKLLCEVYAKFHECDKRAKYPVCFVGIVAPSNMIDVNFEPNKTEVLLQCSDQVMNMLTALLNDFNNIATESDKIIKTTQENSIRTEIQNNLPIVKESHCKKQSNVKRFEVQCNESEHRSILSKSKKNENSNQNTGFRVSQSALEKTRHKKNLTNNSSPFASSNVLNHIRTIKSFFHESVQASEEGEKLSTHSSNMSVAHCFSDSESIDVENVRLKRKRRFSDSSLFSSQSSLSKRHTALNCANSWSRGVIPGEKMLQPEPVCVFVPRNVAKDKSTETGEDSNNQRNEISICGRPQIAKEDTYLENNVQNKSLIRQMTAFDYFCRSNRIEVASCHPEYSNHQIAQMLSKTWNELSEEEKLKYRNLTLNECPSDKKRSEAKTITPKSAASTRVKMQKLKLHFTPKKSETKIDIRFEYLKKSLTSKVSYKNLLDQPLNLINSLAPGVWIYSKNHKLYLLNCFRLQEAIIYRRLLETYELKPEPLVNPIEMAASSLDNSEVLNDLNEVNSEINGCNLSDRKITANGFSASLLKGENETIVKIFAMTSKIPFYGCTDLCEILSILKSKRTETTLSECRPTKVINYIQGEAVRIARQCVTPSRTDVEDILTQSEFLPATCETCIHQKPFSYEFFILSK